MHASGKSEPHYPTDPVPGGSGSRFTTFQALRHRGFRLLWSGLAVSAVGTWMQIVATSLLVLDLTHGSAVALGTVSLAQALSFLLFAPLGGSLADRFDKRRLLMVTQSFLMALAILLGVLTATGAIRFWMIPLLAFAASATLSFDQPTRNALISSLVPRESLMNAVSLQSAVFNGASILGPALAGLALSRLGYAGNFFLNALSYSAVLAVLVFLPVQRGAGHSGRLLESAREALDCVRRDAVLPPVVSAYGALLFFGPSTALLLPLFSRQVVHMGPSGLGLLFAAVGTGTVVGALVIASLGDFPHKARLVFGSILLWSAALALFGFSNSLRISLPVLFLLGAAQNAAGATTTTLLQMRVPPEMRGRAMSLNTLLIMCVRPLGDLPAGFVLSRLGFRATVLLCALIVAAGLLTLLIRPAVRGA
jgi:predicted MFS family arabinose efflux permease